MKNLLTLAVLLLASVTLYSETPLTIAVSPQGAALQTGGTIPLSVACTYAVHAPDDCTAAGGATWSTSATSTAVISVSSTGLVTATGDPGTGVVPGYFVVATAGGLHDQAQVDIQHVGDAWTQYMTPDFHNYKQQVSGTLLPLNVVVGTTVTVGTGIMVDTTSSGTGTPFQGVCNWTSSDNTLATVDRYGFVTAVAPGSVTITCNVPGGWKPGTSGATGWLTPGNYIVLTIVTAPTATNHTWYVRPNGGTPWYDGTSTPYGQCNGLSDADYTGGPRGIWLSNHVYNVGDQIANTSGMVATITVAGTSGTSHPTWTGTGTSVIDNTVTWSVGSAYPTDQNCALGNLRYLWTDMATYEQIFWAAPFQGGDTVIVRQNPNGYVIGDDSQPIFGGPSNCYGAGSECYMPTIPSGSPTHHTKILGENYANCTSDSAKTLLIGQWGVFIFFNTRDTQNVDIQCFEMTDRATCGGNTNFLNNCGAVANSSSGAYGIWESALTANANYTDLYMHGLSQEGIHGPTGLNVVGTNIHIKGMGTGGINMDDNPWAIGNISVAGGLTLTGSTTEFVGCVEIYPVVLNFPYIECRDQTTGNYADGFGTASATGAWIFDHDLWRYNFQDGLDLLHSGLNLLKITNSTSYGNDGQQWKIGSGKQVTFQSNLTLHNCQRVGTLFGDEPNTAIVPNATNAVTHSPTSLVVTYTNGLVVSGVGVTVATPTTGGSVTLAPNTTSYTWIDPVTNTLQMNTTGFPSGTPAQYELAIIITNGTGVPNTVGYYTTKNAQYTLCRAGGDGIAIAFDGLGSDILQNNTYVGYGATSYDMLCAGGWQTCAAANTVFENNINLGILNTTYNTGQLPGLYNQQEDAAFNTVDHNSFYNFRNGCPTLHTGDICPADPLFVNEPPLTISNETTLDNFNFNITSASPAKFAGVHIPGLTTDNVGNPYANPPSMGALEFANNPSTTSYFGGNAIFSGKGTF